MLTMFLERQPVPPRVEPPRTWKWKESMALKKKVAAKRQAWNKGLEVGKRDGFTPAQVKLSGFEGFSRIVVPPGSEIWHSSRRQLIPCCTRRTCFLSL